MKLVLAFMFSLLLAWGYVANTNSLSSPMILITARSTSTRQPWQESPRPSMSPNTLGLLGNRNQETAFGDDNKSETEEDSPRSLSPFLTNTSTHDIDWDDSEESLDEGEEMQNINMGNSMSASCNLRVQQALSGM